MTPEEALDKTINYFGLVAADISRASGVTVQEISRYRRGRKDMVSKTLFKIVDALPMKAKLYFWHLCVFGDDADFENRSLNVS